MSTIVTDCWTLTVLWAFRDAMDAVKPAGIPDTFIGWPAARANADGAWSAFVWFDRDRITTHDGADNHELTVVTGIVFHKDPSKTTQTELEQATATYYAMRSAIAEQADNDDSDFNSGWAGVAEPADEEDGVRPSGAQDFDGTSAIGERWKVTGQGGATGALTS
jgi:hypothetical protein